MVRTGRVERLNSMAEVNLSFLLRRRTCRLDPARSSGVPLQARPAEQCAMSDDRAPYDPPDPGWCDRRSGLIPRRGALRLDMASFWQGELGPVMSRTSRRLLCGPFLGVVLFALVQVLWAGHTHDDGGSDADHLTCATCIVGSLVDLAPGAPEPAALPGPLGAPTASEPEAQSMSRATGCSACSARGPPAR